MKTVLLTGFTPFGGESINPSYEAIKVMTSSKYHLIKCLVSTTFENSIETVISKIDQEHPDLILMVGQAGGRHGISLERFAVNLDDNDIADNQGIIKNEIPIILNGPTAYKTNVSLKPILNALMKKGYPSKISNSAGTYVCNHIMYGVYHYLHIHQLSYQALFVHVPYIHEQVKDKTETFSMSIDEIADALLTIVHTILN